MNENNQLYITITDKRGEGGGGTIPTPTPTSTSSVKDDEKNDSLLRRYAEHEMFHLVKGTTVKAVNYSISNIGNFTGDYIEQKQINEIKGVVSKLTTIGVSTLAGAKYGIVGAAVGFAVGVGSVFVDYIFDDMSNRNSIARNNLNIRMLRDRVGLNTIYDGSRGTEN